MFNESRDSEKTEVASVHRILQREMEEIIEVASDRLKACPLVKHALTEIEAGRVGEERRAFEALEEIVKKEVLACTKIDLYGIGLKRAKVNVYTGLTFGSVRGISVVIEAQASLSRFGKYRKLAAVAANIKIAKV